MSSLPNSSKRLARTLFLAALALTALPAGSALAAPSEDDPPPAPPQLSLSTNSYDYGIVELNRGGQTTNLYLDNSGPDWVPIQISFDGADAPSFNSWDSCGGGVQGRNGCNITVQFNPNDPRDYDATLHVRSGDTDVATQLSGTGGLRQVTATPNPVDFGTTIVGESTTRSVTLQNTGNVFFQSMVAIPVGGDVGAFRLVEDGCSMRVLAPTVGCKLKLRFTPYEADNAEATLAIIGEGDPALITLRGVGVDEPEDDWAPAGPSAPTAASAVAKDKPAPDKPAAKAPATKRPARVAFNWRRGLPAPFHGSRVDLGIARCQGAPTCRVSVRAWFVTTATGEAAGTRTTSIRRATWWVGSGSPVALWIPRGLSGAPKRLIADLTTRAAGKPAGVQRLNVRLLEGIRRGGAVVAAPAKR
jgi:hypothetical protein